MQKFHAPFLEILSIKAVVLAGFSALTFASIVSNLFHVLVIVVTSIISHLISSEFGSMDLHVENIPYYLLVIGKL